MSKAESNADRPHLVHEAYAGLLRRAAEYDEKDWNTAQRFERHAINAALDIKELREKLANLLKSLDPWIEHMTGCSFYHSSSEKSCTCGLRDVMDSLRGGSR